MKRRSIKLTTLLILCVVLLCTGCACSADCEDKLYDCGGTVCEASGNGCASVYDCFGNCKNDVLCGGCFIACTAKSCAKSNYDCAQDCRDHGASCSRSGKTRTEMADISVSDVTYTRKILSTRLLYSKAGFTFNFTSFVDAEEVELTVTLTYTQVNQSSGTELKKVTATAKCYVGTVKKREKVKVHGEVYFHVAVVDTDNFTIDVKAKGVTKE